MATRELHGVKMECVQGNIAEQPDMDAIVNAANAELRIGGGVAGAIHRAAGPGLEAECRSLAPIRPGEAVITGAHNLPNRYVIHCLGPVYGIDKPSDQLLASCYRNALQLTEDNGIRSIAFPAISGKNMKISKKIKEAINKLPAGTTFKYRELDISNNEYGAATKTTERLIAKKIIKRVSTGVFYKPQKTVFGELKPSEENLLRPYLFIGNNRVAYITGTALYNRMGLTSQVPKDIKVASKVKEIRTRIGNINVRRVKSYIDVTSMNYHLLEILDA